MRLTYFHDNRQLTGLYKQETEIRRRKDERCMKKQTDIDRHGTVTTSTSSQPLDPPHFSLPTTFKYRSGSRTLMDLMDLPDMLSRDVGLRLCLAMVEL